MPRGKKVRRIDYNAKEMRELCNIGSRPTFNEHMKKLCKLYGFKLEDFKIDNSKDGDYYFPADFAELLGLLLRNYNNYPLNRANAVPENIKASQIEEYNKLMCNDIDNDIHEVFRKIIYTLPCHYQSLKIGDLTSELVEKLTLFIINITQLDHQEIGDTIRWLCKALDEANYNLFRGSYIRNKAQESNAKFVKEDYNELQNNIFGLKSSNLEDIENELMKANISIDYAISMLIKRILNDTKELNGADKGSEFITSEDNGILKFLGLELTTLEEQGTEDTDNYVERALYYRSIINQYLNQGKYKIAESVIENYNKKIKDRRSILDKIKDGNFRESSEISLSEKKLILEENIRDMQDELERIQDMNDSSDVKANVFLTDLKAEYVKYCENTADKFPQINVAVDRFIGQVLINTLNSDGKV